MARLDARRIDTWRGLQSMSSHLERLIDDALRAEWDIPLGWYDVLSALQTLGGTARPQAVAEVLRLPPSSLSRRMDRLEEEGWIARRRAATDDRRAIEVELTRTGRRLWREMGITYRRAVQVNFAVHLTDDDIEAVRNVLDRMAAVHDRAEQSGD